ncbi:MAG TPA: 50S ribosomal protein L24 [Planctomycetes bacterium]|jgi:large subunit ribosomal protein L24|nr:50S ribosomal protein L24 [Planctomycetota bacterium]
MRIKIGDEVQVIAGNSRGERGKILRINRDTERAVIEGVNIHVKNLKKTQQNPEGGRLEVAMPIALSNVLLWSEKANKGVRTKIEISDDKKIRVGIPCGTKFDS